MTDFAINEIEINTLSPIHLNQAKLRYIIDHPQCASYIRSCICKLNLENLPYFVYIQSINTDPILLKGCGISVSNKNVLLQGIVFKIENIDEGKIQEVDLEFWRAMLLLVHKEIIKGSFTRLLDVISSKSTQIRNFNYSKKDLDEILKKKRLYTLEQLQLQHQELEQLMREKNDPSLKEELHEIKKKISEMKSKKAKVNQSNQIFRWKHLFNAKQLSNNKLVWPIMPSDQFHFSKATDEMLKAYISKQ